MSLLRSECRETQTTKNYDAVRLGGATAWTKRSKTSGEFMAVKKAGSEENGRQKFKGVRRER
jgi:hypothetical protein